MKGLNRVLKNWRSFCLCVTKQWTDNTSGSAGLCVVSVAVDPAGIWDVTQWCAAQHQAAEGDRSQSVPVSSECLLPESSKQQSANGASSAATQLALLPAPRPQPVSTSNWIF